MIATDRQTAGQRSLPLPNPEEWATTADAADTLDVSRQTVHRWTTAGILTAYEIGESPIGRVRVYWRPEVVALARARRIARGPLRG